MKLNVTIYRLALATMLATLIGFFGCRKDQNLFGTEINDAKNTNGIKNSRTCRKGSKIFFPSDVQAKRQIDDFKKLVAGQMTADQYEAREVNEANWVIEATLNFNHPMRDSLFTILRHETISVNINVVNGIASPQEMVAAFKQFETAVSNINNSDPKAAVAAMFLDIENFVDNATGVLILKGDISIYDARHTGPCSLACPTRFSNGAFYSKQAYLDSLQKVINSRLNSRLNHCRGAQKPAVGGTCVYTDFFECTIRPFDALCEEGTCKDLLLRNPAYQGLPPGYLQFYLFATINSNYVNIGQDAQDFYCEKYLELVQRKDIIKCFCSDLPVDELEAVEVTIEALNPGQNILCSGGGNPYLVTAWFHSLIVKYARCRSFTEK